MAALESFAQRLHHLRVARGLSERDLAQRIGITVRQYEALTCAGMEPTCSLLVDLANALDVSFAQLTELVDKTPTPEQLRVYFHELQRCRMTTTRLLSHVDRQLATVCRALAIDGEPDERAASASAALIRSVERNETLRACGSRYARLVLLRCAGNRRRACRLLGISYHTLREYLRYPPEREGVSTQMAGAAADNGLS
jgi:transcriptional regulator with XRE-family HTH domain